MATYEEVQKLRERIAALRAKIAEVKRAKSLAVSSAGMTPGEGLDRAAELFTGKPGTTAEMVAQQNPSAGEVWQKTVTPEPSSAGVGGLARNVARTIPQVAAALGQGAWDMGTAGVSAIHGEIGPEAQKKYQKALETVGEFVKFPVQQIYNLVTGVGLNPVAGGANPIFDALSGRSEEEVRRDYPQYAKAVEELYQMPLGPLMAFGMAKGAIGKVPVNNAYAKARGAAPYEVPSEGVVALREAIKKAGGPEVMTPPPAPVEAAPYPPFDVRVTSGVGAPELPVEGVKKGRVKAEKPIPPATFSPLGFPGGASREGALYGSQRAIAPQIPGTGTMQFGTPETIPTKLVRQKLPEPAPVVPEAGVSQNPLDPPYVYLHGGFGAVEPALKKVVELGRGWIPDFFKQSQNRFQDKDLGHEFTRKVMWQLDPTYGNLAGNYMEKLRLGGLRDKGVREHLADWMDAGDARAKPFLDAMHEMWLLAKSSGVNVGGYIQNYFPRMMKREISEAMWNDLLSETQRDQRLAKIPGGTDPVLAGLVKQRVDAGEYHTWTRAAITHLVRTGQAADFSDAFLKLRGWAYDDLFRPFGNLEKHRMLELPKDFYERDAAKVLTRYTNSWAKRVAEVSTFGPNGEGLVGILNSMRESSPADAKTAERLIRMWTGDIEHTEGLGEFGTKATRAYTAGSVSTKIALGWATIKNVTQTAISTASEAGWARTLEGTIKLLDPARRSEVRRSGATLATAIRAIAGYDPEGISGRVSRIMAKGSGFEGVNKVNQYIAASTGIKYIRDLHRIANSESGLATRRTWARTKLAEYDIDYQKPLNDVTTDHFAYRFAQDSQLQRNVMTDPMVFNDPRFRAMALFQRFAAKQAIYVKDHIIKEMGPGKRNPMPIMRLIAGGVIGGEASLWAINQIKQLASGQPQTREDEALFERFANDLAAVGAVGRLTDFVAADDKLREAIRAGTPLPISDATRLVEIGQRVGVDWDEYDLKDVLQRAIKPVSGLLGSIPAQGARRLQTEGQKRNVQEDQFGKARTAVFEAMRDKDNARVRMLIRAWDTRNPDRPFGPNDISSDEFGKFLAGKKAKREGESKSSAQLEYEKIIRDYYQPTQ